LPALAATPNFLLLFIPGPPAPNPFPPALKGPLPNLDFGVGLDGG
jgi:hypothetical protein